MKVYCLLLSLTFLHCSNVNEGNSFELFGQYETQLDEITIGDGTKVVHKVIWDFQIASFEINHFTDTIRFLSDVTFHKKHLHRFAGPSKISGDTIHVTITHSGFIQSDSTIHLNKIEIAKVGEPPNASFYCFRKLDSRGMELIHDGTGSWTKVSRNSPSKHSF